MKKIFLLLFLTCGFLLSSAEEKLKFPIENKETRPSGQRSPNYGSDIMAYYQDGVIYLQFAYDMGEVEISVFNETTGEMWQQTDDTTFGSATIATSTSAGNYYIIIVTDDVSCYTGNFSL
ncbi:MAG: DUF3244 domain-containing protein [Muribaculaceae bacterium]|nr:DUF3244 domain-containing protein [Muribaculaceae bacterium]